MPIPDALEGRRKEYARFLLAFVFLGFIMKVAGEIVHEAGHILLVLIFGGRILEFSISATWPFALSYTRWEMTAPSNTQLALIAVAGLVFDILTSLFGQGFLLSKRRIHPLAEISVFWLSFWTYLNSVVYLTVGAAYPFGDMLDLTRAVQVPTLLVGLVGVMLLVSNSYFLSIILRGIFSRLLPLRRASEMVSIFWASLHMFFVLLIIVTYGLPTPPSVAPMILVMIFIWSYISAKWLLVGVSSLRVEREATGLPLLAERRFDDSSLEDRVRRRNLRLGYITLILAALISALLTGYMISQYLSTYSLVMKTGIEAEVTSFDSGPDELVLGVNFTITNPNRMKLSLKRIEFDLKLNDRFMEHQILGQIPEVEPESYSEFSQSLTLPLDRMFTVEQAKEEGRWEWTITGTGYVETLLGETLLRFTSTSFCGPNAR